MEVYDSKVMIYGFLDAYCRHNSNFLGANFFFGRKIHILFESILSPYDFFFFLAACSLELLFSLVYLFIYLFLGTDSEKFDLTLLFGIRSRTAYLTAK